MCGHVADMQLRSSSLYYVSGGSKSLPDNMIDVDIRREANGGKIASLGAMFVRVQTSYDRSERG